MHNDLKDTFDEKETMILDVFVPEGQEQPWVIASSPQEASRVLAADAVRRFRGETANKYQARSMVRSDAESFDLYFDEAHDEHEECPLNKGANSCATCSPSFDRQAFIDKVGADQVVWEYQ